MCTKAARKAASVAALDRILVFEDGKVVEQGPHASLLAARGTCARMWHMQSHGFLGERPAPPPRCP
ncbi:MAG: hypothetical protein GC129_03875 [Proteobacteria bacterium]|nr:hypothetical protein [Pseudomonadota bacterium]